MVNEIVIWNAPQPPVRYGAAAARPITADVGAHDGGAEDYTDADYVPVKTYLQVARTAVRVKAVDAEIVPSANAAASHPVSAARANAGIELYTSIFNYRHVPTHQLSILA